MTAHQDITLRIDPRRSALLAGHDNDCTVLVRVCAPPQRPASAVRTPLNLALVLDRSGSMSGRPLEQAIRCAGFIVDRLEATDRAAIVVYDNRVDTLVPAQPVVDRNVFHRALAGVASGGCTALFGGWQGGIAQASPAAGAEYLSRVLLLSDGCANEGLADVDAIVPFCQQAEAAGVSTSTYGLGSGFNEELMVAMARAGRGQSYYGETAEDLMDPFTEEFDLLRAVCARRLRLTLTAADGVSVRVHNDYVRAGDGAWLLPDLAYGGEAWALVSLRVPAVLCTEGATVADLLQTQLAFEDMAADVAAAAAAGLGLNVLPAAAFAAIADDERVVARARELRAAGLQLQARDAARCGDWRRVEAILDRADKEARDNPWVAESLAELRRFAASREVEAFAKEAMYKSRRMNTRQAAADEQPGHYSEQLQAIMPTFLRRKRREGRRLGPDAGPAEA